MDDPNAREILKRGGTHEDVAVYLFNILREQFRINVHANMITPKRIVCDDGSQYVWRCPAELIPETKIGNFAEKIPKKEKE